MKNLESYTVNASNTNYEAVDGILFNEAQTELISYPANKLVLHIQYLIPLLR